MLLGGEVGHGVENVREEFDAFFHGPGLHRRGDRIRHRARIACGADAFNGTWIHKDGASTAIATIQVINGQLSAQVVQDGYQYGLHGSVNGNQATINLLIEDQVIPGTLALVNGTMIATVQGEQFEFTRKPMADAQGQMGGQQPGQGPQEGLDQQPGNQVGAGDQPQPVVGQIILQRKILRDPGVKNMESHTILVPKGWQVTGQAFWASPNFFKVLPSQHIRVAAPHGPEVILAPHVAAFDFWPSAQSMQLGMQRPKEGASNNGYPVIHMPADDAGWRR